MEVMAKSETTLVHKDGKVISVQTKAEGLDELAEPGKTLLQADLHPQVLKTSKLRSRDTTGAL